MAGLVIEKVVTKKNGRRTGYFLPKNPIHKEKFKQPKNRIAQYLRDDCQTPTKTASSKPSHQPISLNTSTTPSAEGLSKTSSTLAMYSLQERFTFMTLTK